jgi:hypothetical protein
MISRRTTVAAVGLALALLSNGPSVASTYTYSYTGNTYDTAQLPFTTMDHEFLSLTFSSQLPASSTSTFCSQAISCTSPAGITVKSFSYSDGHLALTDSSGSFPALNYYFSLQTNLNGDPVYWSLFASNLTEGVSSCSPSAGTPCYNPANHPPQDIASTNSGGPNVFASFQGPGGCWGINGNVCSVATATPLPASLPLLVSGLSMVSLLGWRRNRVKAKDSRAS